MTTTTHPISALQINRVSQAKYAETIRSEILLACNADDEQSVVILILCPLLKEVNDEKSPIFVFSLNADAKEQALEAVIPWAEKFQSEHFIMPALTLQYGMAVMPESEFEKLLAEPSFYGDGILISAKINFWQNQQ